MSAICFGCVYTAVARNERWLRLIAPDLTIITTLSRRDALQQADEFVQYIGALQRYFHGQTSHLAPLTIVIFDREREFEAYRPLRNDGKAEKVGGFFVRRGSWAMIGMPVAFNSDARHVIYHEGVHWFMDGLPRRYPIWYNEGMAEAFASFRVLGRRVQWGQAYPGYVRYLHSETLLPIAKLLVAKQGDLYHDNSYGTDIFYAESWAFVHFLTFSRHPAPAGAIDKYADLLTAGDDSAEAFQAAFGRSIKEAEHQFHEYLDGGEYYVSDYPAVPSVAVAVAPAPAVEVEAALGRLALGAGRYPLAIEHGRALVAENPDDSRGHELLGAALAATHAEEESVAEYRLAVKSHTADFEPYFAVAVAVQNRAVQDGASLTSAEVREILDNYEHAISYNPSLRVAYDNIAGVIGDVGAVQARDRAVLLAGTQRYPTDPAIQVALAEYDWVSGHHSSARARLDRVIRSTPDDLSGLGHFARQVEGRWDEQEFQNQLGTRLNAADYAGALKLIDARLAETGDAMERVQLITFRRGVADELSQQQLNTALDNQNGSEARRIIATILGSKDASPTAKQQAAQILSQLDRKTTAAP